MAESLYPYKGTSGWRGSSASRDRAVEDDRSGRTKQRHALTMAYFDEVLEDGLAVFELRALTRWHHGICSGALTRAHRIGAIERLVERRGQGTKSKGAHIYVLKGYADGRVTEPYRPASRRELLSVVQGFLADDDIDGLREYIEDEINYRERVVPIKPVEEEDNGGTQRRRIIPRRPPIDIED